MTNRYLLPLLVVLVLLNLMLFVLAVTEVVTDGVWNFSAFVVTAVLVSLSWPWAGKLE